MKYNTGDKVIIQPIGKLRTAFGYTPYMENFSLRVVTLTRYIEFDGTFFIEEDNYGYSWVPETFLRKATLQEILDGGVRANFCVFCGKEIRDGESTSNYDGKRLCHDCSLENSFCAHCDKICRIKDMEHIGGKTVCRRCAPDFYSCFRCGEYFHIDDLTPVNDGHFFLCCNCASENINTCHDCGENFTEDNLIVGEDGESYCQDCYDEKYLAIHDYHYGHDKPIIFFGSTNQNSLYLGAEIEVDCNEYVDMSEREDLAKEMKKIMPDNFVSMETDGSLENGFENITMPATMEYHHSIMEKYRDMFEIAIDGGMRAHKTRTCGLHVHFNRSFYENREEECLAKLLYLVETHWDNLVKFSRRNYAQLRRWANKYDKSPEEVIKDMKDGRAERYTAVNLTNNNTIEFRLFRGTLRLESYIATLQLVDTMVKFSKTVPIEDLRKMPFTDFMLYPEIKDYWETVKDRQVRN